MQLSRILRSSVLFAAAVSAVGLTAVDAAAQTLAPPAARPIDGLFGRARGGDGVAVSLRTFEAYDDDQLGEGAGLFDPRLQKSGVFDGLDATVGVKHAFRRISFDANGQSSARYYPAFADLLSMREDASARLSGDFTRTRFTAEQTVAYAPYFTYSTLPQLYDGQSGPGIAPNQYLLRRPALIAQSSVSLSETLGRATFSFAGTTQRTTFVEETGSQLRADSASGGLVYHVSRDVGLVARYMIQHGTYDLSALAPTIAQFHTIELGVDYDHALSLTRRSTIGFATGTTAVRDTNGAPAYRLVGDVRFSREFGRTWHATASYHRGASLIAGFSQPIFADGLQIGVTGALSRRLILSTTAGATAGEVTGTRERNGTANYTGASQLQFALSRMLALTGDYSYYKYAFDNSEGLPPGFLPHLARQSIRVGLTFWLPLFQ